MGKIEKWIANLNKQQKIIIGIVMPVILLIISLTIADNVAQADGYYPGHPFKFHVTWWVWLLFVIIVGLFEFKLFEKKNHE